MQSKSQAERSGTSVAPPSEPPAAGGADAGRAGGGRLAAIDLLRGLAIVMMVAANAAAVILRGPHPFGFRLFGSCAAPIFVTLAGMMVALMTRRDRQWAASGSARRHNLLYYLARGGVIVLAAIGVDVRHGLPLVTFDVLYVIGLSLPAAYLLSWAPLWARWSAPIALFSMTPLVQTWWGYELSIDQPPLDTPLSELPLLLPVAARRFLVDGWFPLFPWLGFTLLGVALEGLMRPDRSSFRLDVRVGAMVLAVGAVVWWLAPGPLAIRLGYSELFYPPTPGFLLTAIGVLLILIPLVEQWSDWPVAALLQPLGQCTLFLYIVHLLVIDWICKPLTPDLAFGAFLSVYGVLLASLWLLAVGVDRLKRYCRAHDIALPLVLALILGG